jgi:hypothetical protein
MTAKKERLLGEPLPPKAPAPGSWQAVERMLEGMRGNGRHVSLWSTPPYDVEITIVCDVNFRVIGRGPDPWSAAADLSAKLSTLSQDVFRAVRHAQSLTPQGGE